MGKKQGKDPEDFWREYEEKINEKVLAHGLGRYISGWEKFDRLGWNNLWGLLIVSQGGFRFHHFPQQNWFDMMFTRGDTEGSGEKILFIPKEEIIHAETREETRWWAKILSSNPPLLIIHCRGETGDKKQVFLEAERGVKELAAVL